MVDCRNIKKSSPALFCPSQYEDNNNYYRVTSEFNLTMGIIAVIKQWLDYSLKTLMLNNTLFVTALFYRVIPLLLKLYESVLLTTQQVVISVIHT